MLNNKILTEFTNLFSRKFFLKNDKTVYEYWQ